jgi:hypothetical protein
MPPRRDGVAPYLTKDLFDGEVKNATAAVPNRDPIPSEEQEGKALLDAVGEAAVFTEALNKVEFRNVFVVKAFLNEFARRNHFILKCSASSSKTKDPTIAWVWTCSHAGAYRARPRGAAQDTALEAHEDVAGAHTKKTSCPVRFSLTERLPDDDAAARPPPTNLRSSPADGAHNHPTGGELLAAEERARGVSVSRSLAQTIANILLVNPTAQQVRTIVLSLGPQHDVSPMRISNLIARVRRRMANGEVVSIHDMASIDDVQVDEFMAFLGEMKNKTLKDEGSDIISALQKLATAIVGFRFRLLTEMHDGVEVLKAFSFSTAHQRTMFLLYGQLVHIDATHNANAEGWPLTAVCIKTCYGKLASVLFCFAGNDFAHDVQNFIYESLVDMCADDHREKLHINGARVPTLSRAHLAEHVLTFMSDEAYDEHIMQANFPGAHQRYCSYHLCERFAQKMMHKDTSKPLLEALVYTTCTEEKFDELLLKFEEAEPALAAHMRENGYFDESELRKWAGMYMPAHFTAGVFSNSLAESFNAMFKSFDKFAALRLSEVVLRALALQYQFEREHQRLQAKFKLEIMTR